MTPPSLPGIPTMTTDATKVNEQDQERAERKHADVFAKIDAAERVVRELCDGKRKWTMSVPARPDHDPDLVIFNALFAARRALGAALSSAPLAATSKVVVDPSIPEDEVHFVQDGKTVGKIVDIGPSSAPLGGTGTECFLSIGDEKTWCVRCKGWKANEGDPDCPDDVIDANDVDHCPLHQENYAVPVTLAEAREAIDALAHELHEEQEAHGVTLAEIESNMPSRSALAIDNLIKRQHPPAPLPSAVEPPTLLGDHRTSEEMATWCDETADACEGEDTDDCWNLRSIARRLRGLGSSPARSPQLDAPGALPSTRFDVEDLRETLMTDLPLSDVNILPVLHEYPKLMRYQETALRFALEVQTAVMFHGGMKLLDECQRRVKAMWPLVSEDSGGRDTERLDSK